jgi:hypothetical protein
MKSLRTRNACAAIAIAFAAISVPVGSAQAASVIKSYFEFKQPKMVAIPGDLSTDMNGKAAPVASAGAVVASGFEGISQYDGAAFGRNFIPPDTMGAVGRSQYMEVSNGAYSVFDKYTGAQLSLTSDVAFWAGAGQTGTNGDTRIMYNAAASRWVMVAFGADTKDLQVAVSNTDNALGGWQSVKFEGYNGFGFGATADYPTLALDNNAVYIGTNNFAPATAGGTNSFRGTTLNVIPLNSLFSALAPTVANMKQIVTPYTGGAADIDGGFALQGVNSTSASSSGTVVAASLFDFDSLVYRVNGLTASSATGATRGSIGLVGQAAFTTAGAARQPDVIADVDVNLTDTITSNKRVVAAGDERISSSVYEANGRIYFVNTVNSGLDARDEARVRYTVLDGATLAILDQGDIGVAGYDYYQGSIAVNALGQVVIGYNRSGLDANTGKIGIYTRLFSTGTDGKLIAEGGEYLLKESLVDDYHNGSVAGQVAVGRQRWGDYSQVSIDPNDQMQFYIIGQFAREYNNAAGGHPGGTGGSRWGTFISHIDFSAAVPEPGTWTMMVAGFGMVGGAMRRRQRTRLTFRMV